MVPSFQSAKKKKTRSIGCDGAMASIGPVCIIAYHIAELYVYVTLIGRLDAVSLLVIIMQHFVTRGCEFLIYKETTNRHIPFELAEAESYSILEGCYDRQRPNLPPPHAS